MASKGLCLLRIYTQTSCKRIESVVQNKKFREENGTSLLKQKEENDRGLEMNQLRGGMSSQKGDASQVRTPEAGAADPGRWRLCVAPGLLTCGSRAAAESRMRGEV